MRKLTFFAILLTLCNVVFAGGLLTNTNQSAQFIRMMSRNASYEIDAVYYNPAGVIKLEDGWHFAFHSQTIFQERNVESRFPLLNDGKYVGEVTVPVFPTAFAVYKKENWAFSLGFGPNGGGGTAEFERGLPSFEIPISKAVPGLAGLTQINPALAVKGYDADLSFSGTSIFWGIQLGATYKISDMLSVYGGVRYLPSKNVYQGTISNVQLESGGKMNPAPAWLNGVAGQVKQIATVAYGGAQKVQPIIDGGGGTLTLTQLEAMNMITATDKAQLEGGLKTLGVTQEQINAMNVNTIQGTYKGAGDRLTGTAAALEGTAGQLGDREVDAEQTGAGFTPMIGVNISPNDDWNIGIKYEHKTYMTLTNSTKVDDLGLFPDKAKVKSDVPGILGIGIGYKGLKWMEAQFSYTQFFNKRVGWGGNTRDMAVWKSVDPTKIRKREIENNGYETGLGFQFNLSESFSVSVGGLYGDLGVADSYQSDFSYTNPSTTIGAGFMWKITDQLKLDAGMSNTFYQDQTVTFSDPNVNNYNDIYGKTALTFAVGLSYSIF
jgi:long-subunit fatty acid transport protein